VPPVLGDCPHNSAAVRDEKKLGVFSWQIPTIPSQNERFTHEQETQWRRNTDEGTKEQLKNKGCENRRLNRAPFVH